jgi:Ala-tRNA(Pro) deacylase
MSVYERLVGLLDSRGAEYRLIHHHGVTTLAGRLRAQPVTCAIVQIGPKFVLAVVRDDQQVALDALRRLHGGARVSHVTKTMAEELSGCVTGTIVPFSFRPDLSLVMDRELVVAQEILFPAARPDVSIALNTSDYLRFAAPCVASCGQTPLADAA